MVEIKQEVLDDMLCNLCGKSLKKYMDRDNKVFNYCGLEEVSMVCGYESKNDGTTFTFSLCEDCVDGLMNKFVIPAEKKSMWDEEE